ncbi:MAG: rubrerythrin [Proteobacteria bacterium]|nr:rubrerythrin [Pseudomonadota bacterium]NDC24850.1 rubrerythrin [Pseudomonadota bacterium]NDD04848.1 rubrerythrin [Pseudomonadota bacterium]NDG27080.1 rubrerythrin [Pseudomonadota bacterium]
MKPKRFEQSQTKKNLEAAFAGESMANRKYLYFARIARELGDSEVAAVFEETAQQETEHALSHLSLLYPKDELTVTQLLELAIEGERYEHTTMYPGFEKLALEEAREDAAKEFAEQAKESKEHDERFMRALVLAKKRFAALTKIEKIHADRYQSILIKRKGTL